MSTSYLALDLVLIPSKNIQEEIISINDNLKESHLNLHLDRTIPHLTISMLRIKAEEYHRFVEKLTDYLEVLDLDELSTLNITSIYKHNVNTVGWNLSLNDPLKHLHYSVATLMKAYHQKVNDLKYNKDFAITHPQIPFSGIEYLNNFYEENAFENYQPHITIGQGESKTCIVDLGKEIEFEKISLFQMGTGCTCEKMLWEMKISNNK